MSSPSPASGKSRHWVAIETGANQAYVFASNKQAVNVGASELIFRSGTEWVRTAVDKINDERTEPVVEIVVAASGKALLLADDEDAGRRVIRAVTRRALDEAPGLEIWGTVDPGPDPGPDPVADDADLGPALTRAYQRQAAWRSRRPSPLLRHPTLPFTRPCHYSGQPSTAMGEEGGTPYPRAASVDAAWRRRNAGRDRMAGKLGNEAVVDAAKLADGVSHAGWVAVMHADGNGIGGVFRSIADSYAGREFLDNLGAFSRALDEVTVAALRYAVDQVTNRTGWLLPLVVGGDDVTVVMDARPAFEVTATFVEQFARTAAAHPVVARVLTDVGHPGLTACAGIAYVKPHYPFSEAYELAEQLCGSAKQVKQVDPSCGALDFHVLHDSVGRSLDRIRMPLTVQDGGSDRGESRLWPGPVVIGAPQPGGWAAAHDVTRLREVVEALGGGRGEDDPPVLARGALHRLRQALLTGRTEAVRASDQVSVWAADPAAARSFLDEHLLVAEPSVDRPVSFSRILGAVDLIDMAAGTAPHAGREPRRSGDGDGDPRVRQEVAA
ncbi:Cas10/Cmr2 second palm domain-containing protein [Micromonospora sp. LOL_021]|uniref:Cas10/Cmr2 second palm domain-containing protein n=1 Tax=Micromonospora sp. LOL_021 TaxID=3345417 RepID=UPI003A878D49